MLVGLILRGVVVRLPRQGARRAQGHVEPRSSSPARCWPRWRRAGCWAATSPASTAACGRSLFAAGIALTLPTAYAMLGAGWLIMKTEGELQRKAVRWARKVLWPMGARAGRHLAGDAAGEPDGVRQAGSRCRSSSALLPIPRGLRRRVLRGAGTCSASRTWCSAAMAGWCSRATVLIFVLAFLGLAYSLYPYIVIDRLTVWQAASAHESLVFIFVGVAITLPAIIVYTVFMYRVFWGRATTLSYGAGLRGAGGRPAEGREGTRRPRKRIAKVFRLVTARRLKPGSQTFGCPFGLASARSRLQQSALRLVFALQPATSSPAGSTSVTAPMPWPQPQMSFQALGLLPSPPPKLILLGSLSGRLSGSSPAARTRRLQVVAVHAGEQARVDDVVASAVDDRLLVVVAWRAPPGSR